jgi:hypothetical protein
MLMVGVHGPIATLEVRLTCEYEMALCIIALGPNSSQRKPLF